MYLLDTNVVSELRKMANGKIDPNVRAWFSDVHPSETWISVVTLSEIQTGILNVARKDDAQAQLLKLWFENKVLPVYQERVLPIDTAVALLAAHLHIPNKRDINDAYIAATAKTHDLTLVTRNIKDFQHAGLKLLNPFQAA